MNYWLFKTEPDVYGIDDLAGEPDQIGRWDGIRNYQARNFLRDKVASSDRVLIYHSSCKPVGIAGIAEVVREAYPDPCQFDESHPGYDAKSTQDNPRWFNVDLRFSQKFAQLITLSSIKHEPVLENMMLLKQGRLSVQPVSSEEWEYLLSMAHRGK